MYLMRPQGPKPSTDAPKLTPAELLEERKKRIVALRQKGQESGEAYLSLLPQYAVQLQSNHNGAQQPPPGAMMSSASPTAGGGEGSPTVAGAAMVAASLAGTYARSRVESTSDGSNPLSADESGAVRPTSRRRRRRVTAEDLFARNVQLSSTLLGTGAFGVVYLGVHQTTGKWIAVKKISVKAAGGGSANASGSAQNKKKAHIASQLDEIVEEIRLMKDLDHDHIVKYLHAERNEEELTIFMEYMSGGSLAGMLKKFDVLPEPMLRVYMLQAIQGVAYLHQRNIVHRDIKADNILLHSDGTVKLSDFGTSREVSDSANLLTVTGTPWFMAPEVIKGTGHGASADIWSIGCTMIQMVRGQAPFSEYSSPVTAMYHVALNPQNVLRYIPETVSPALRECLHWCLQETPSLRPTALQLLGHRFFVGEPLGDEDAENSDDMTDATSVASAPSLAPHPPVTQGSLNAMPHRPFSSNVASAQVPQVVPLANPAAGLAALRGNSPDAGRQLTPKSLSLRLREATQNQQRHSSVAVELT